MIFIDEAELVVRGGSGGNGCMAFRREKFVPRGGPSGGDGGDGGSVYLVGDEGLNTLHHLRGRKLWSAERGRHGEGSNRTGRTGEDVLVPVPPGTQAWEADAGPPRLLGEVMADGERLLVAAGGRGGRGNARFATATHRAPRRHDRVAGQSSTRRPAARRTSRASSETSHAASSTADGSSDVTCRV